MRTSTLAMMAALLVISGTVDGQEKREKPETEALKKSRRVGLELATTIVKKMPIKGLENAEGLRAFVEDVNRLAKRIDVNQEPQRWPEIDEASLVSQNPRFWQATYEMNPGDPGWTVLYASLLLAAGEAHRCLYVAIIGLQKDAIPPIWRGALVGLAHDAIQVIKEGEAFVQKGVTLFDTGHREEAARIYRSAVEAWPQNSLAYHELGMTLWYSSEEKAGRIHKLNEVLINQHGKLPPEINDCYAKSRLHNPWQFMSYQGTIHNADDLAAFLKASDEYQQFRANARQRLSEQVLSQFCDALQRSGNDDYALFTRQILVSRRGRFDPSDHPFIMRSLRHVAPGPVTESVLQRLAGPGLLDLNTIEIPVLGEKK
jgi:tetratricopeptide (TPR) repeat protein